MEKWNATKIANQKKLCNFLFAIFFLFQQKKFKARFFMTVVQVDSIRREHANYRVPVIYYSYETWLARRNEICSLRVKLFENRILFNKERTQKFVQLLTQLFNTNS